MKKMCVLMSLSSGDGVVGVVFGAVAEHGVEDVDAASGQGDEGLVVSFALGDLAVLVGAGDGVAEGGEGGEEQRPFQGPVAPL